MKWSVLPLVALGFLAGGCNDNTTAPRDIYPPAAPRGFYSITADHAVILRWLANTEGDLAGYRIYQGPCASGPGCPFTRIGSLDAAATEFTVTGLQNGVTQFFAVAAVDRNGNESDLSYEDVYDTPRPEGFGAVITNYLTTPRSAGWDYSTYAAMAWDNLQTDMFYGYYVEQSGLVHQQVFVPDYATNIQDMGFAQSLDFVDFAPGATEGWSPSGTVEAIVGHCYVVWTRDDHFAKFRITSLAPGSIGFDWAYQVDVSNRELKARPAREEYRRRPIVWLPATGQTAVTVPEGGRPRQ